MKRFSAAVKWNDEIAEKFRKRFLQNYRVDLKKYVPQCENDFEDKWKSIEKAAFGEIELFKSFDKEYIHQILNDIILGKTDGSIITNAVNRYEFYEPDIWIGAAYTIYYLENSEELKKASFSEMLIEQDKSVFSVLLDTEQNGKITPTYLKDATRWSWQGILEIEKDKLRPKLDSLKRKNRAQNLLVQQQELAKYILFLRLTNGEMLRRIIPLFSCRHFTAFDAISIKQLCEIESLSWQILMVEIKRQLETEKEGDGFHVMLVGTEDVEDTDYGHLLKWVNKDLSKKINFINKKRKFWVNAMVYLYMASEERIRLGLLEEIQKQAINSIDTMSTPSFCNFKKTVNTYIAQSTGSKPEESNVVDINIQRCEETICIDIKDSLTLDIINDLTNRVKKNKDKGIKKLSKIRLQLEENTLTALYVKLQRMVIRLTANHYEIVPSKEGKH
jgi:hypothetical protein|nr:hypothetical protein [uncultured Acetatifactor sp.]